MVKPKSRGKNPAKPGDLRPKTKLARGRPSLSEASSRPGGRSPMLALRLPPADIEKIDKLAAAEGVARSEMARGLLLAGIAAHKPSKQPK